MVPQPRRLPYELQQLIKNVLTLTYTHNQVCPECDSWVASDPLTGTAC
jgi:hypothetical protein